MLGGMKASEYGGADTDKNDGVQPSPHVPKPHELMRKLYVHDNPADPTSGADIAGEFGKA
jgi:hypothetical protein